ncbi:MAG TPA: amidohydrolase family protein, partial [Polymorphobacter sp.]|nr:amidohydrolase family protein [Polymorphobacter sp.]
MPINRSIRPFLRPVAGLALLHAGLLSGTAVFAANADAIWYGGHIITVDAKASTAEAVAVKDGLIVAVGKKADVEKAERGPATAMNNLQGNTMTPGFIDGHSHFSFALDMADQANASAPPVGPGSSPAAIVAALKQFASARNTAPGELIVGYGYDETQMPNGQLLSRDILDAAFPNNPVYVIHVSGHGAVLNSLAFKKYGISAATPTPPGGVIQRKPGSMEPSGLVMETGYLPVFLAKVPPTPEQLVKQLKSAQEMYACAGITTAQDGATHTNDLANFQKFAAGKQLYLDLVSYAFFLELDPILKANPPANWGKYSNNFKLGGCKIVSDGSPQGKTAAFTTPYLTGGPNGEVNWKGELSATQDQFNTAMKLCYDNGLQVLVHVNGDAAVDAAMKAHEFAAAGSLGKDRRTVFVHSQFARL